MKCVDPRKKTYLTSRSSPQSEDKNAEQADESTSIKEKPGISKTTSNDKVALLVSDSLLLKLDSRKFYIKGTRTVRLTKSGDKAINVDKHAVDYVKQNSKYIFEAVVLLGGTNDLTHKSFKSEDVFKELKQASDSLLELENVNKVFLCKVPTRLDNEAVDVKVNELSCQITNHAIAKNSNQLVIINSVNRKCKNLNKYG